MTNKEAKAALLEVVLDKDVSDQHIEETYIKITEKEEKDNGIQD